MSFAVRGVDHITLSTVQLRCGIDAQTVCGFGAFRRAGRYVG